MIISRTPFRISFAGGGTDLEGFWRNEYGAVLSCTIDKYMFITVNRRFDHTLRVSYSKTEIVDSADDLSHPIVREALKLLGLKQGLEITSVGDIPAGTGMGSSSSFAVGLLHALHTYRGDSVSPEQLACEACHLEIEVLHEPIGKQDQYIAAYGGLRQIRFQPDGSVLVDPVTCPGETREALFQNLIMFYTGISRKARTILKTQKTETASKRQTLRRMRDLALDMREILLNGRDLQECGGLLDQEWQLKRSLVNGISTPAIDACYARAKNAGALGGKLLGAGGGGFLLLYVEGPHQRQVREALTEWREVPVTLEPQGSKIIYVGD
jgi:D-glycero-alpha-D-manno-heptose-7-phosphate kinase